MEREGAVVDPGLSLAEAYVFDLDGTLATLPVDWERVKQGLREITGSEEEFRSVFPTIIDVLKKHPSEQRRMFALMDEYELAAVPAARLYPGSEELLSMLAERSKLSLVTMQGARACDLLLERFNLKQYFLASFTRDDSLDRAEQVRFALDAMGASKESSVFVGDRLNDLRAAKSLGVPFTMIRTHGEDPKEDVPVFHSVSEFLDALRSR